MDKDSQQNVHIFPTTFYNRLLDRKKTFALNLGLNVSSLTESEINYLGVQNWTKNTDLFQKQLLLIPICEANHWYLVAVIFPGLFYVS